MAVTGVVCGPAGSAVASAVAEVAVLVGTGNDDAASWAIVDVASVAALGSATGCGVVSLIESTARCATSGKTGAGLLLVFLGGAGATSAGVAARDVGTSGASMLRVEKLRVCLVSWSKAVPICAGEAFSTSRCTSNTGTNSKASLRQRAKPSVGVVLHAMCAN